MQVMILVALLTLITAGAWLSGRQRTPETAEPETQSVQELLTGAGTVECAGRALDALRKVMEHPQLGGPGFLSVLLPPLGYGQLEALAQYPNIGETLYRRIVRGELEREELIGLGVPEELFALDAEFAAESGGMVLLQAAAGRLTPELERLLADRRGRTMTLDAMSEALQARYPDLTVRIVGSDILLTPQEQRDYVRWK